MKPRAERYGITPLDTSLAENDDRSTANGDIFNSPLVIYLRAWIDFAIAESDAHHDVLTDVDVEALARAAGITDAEWEALAMVGEGLNQREAAGLLAVTQQAVQRRLQRARQKLRDNPDLISGLSDSCGKE